MARSASQKKHVTLKQCGLIKWLIICFTVQKFLYFMSELSTDDITIWSTHSFGLFYQTTNMV